MREHDKNIVVRRNVTFNESSIPIIARIENEPEKEPLEISYDLYSTMQEKSILPTSFKTAMKSTQAEQWRKNAE